MDAERGRGEFVIMKIIGKRDHPEELDIARYLTEFEDSRNHCVPLLDFFDAFDDPQRTILVMPLLKRFNDPPFETVWEVVECIGQLFEVRVVRLSPTQVLSQIEQGLQFMHDHNVAHRFV